MDTKEDELIKECLECEQCETLQEHIDKCLKGEDIFLRIGQINESIKSQGQPYKYPKRFNK